jgi:hypothetical protein
MGAKNTIGKIDLTADEERVLAQIKFPARGVALECDDGERNGELVAELIHALLNRKGIPEVRLRYYADSEYNPSHPKTSRREFFLRNAGNDEAAYRHPHFLKYLHYFVYGADLPEKIKGLFQETASESFVKPQNLVDRVRWLIRSSDIERYPRDYELHDKFYQLALDCECFEGDARRVRSTVMTTK